MLGRTKQPRQYHEFLLLERLEYSKKSLFKSSQPNKYLLNFPTRKKIPESKISNPKKSFDLEIPSSRSTPAPLGQRAALWNMTSKTGQKQLKMNFTMLKIMFLSPSQDEWKPHKSSNQKLGSSSTNYGSSIGHYLMTNSLITKCIQHFMIHKRRNLSRCPITQSSESMQQSVYRFFSYTSLQKVFKLILPPNRHFSLLIIGYSDDSTTQPRPHPEYLRRLLQLLFSSYERCNFFITAVTL